MDGTICPRCKDWQNQSQSGMLLEASPIFNKSGVNMCMIPSDKCSGLWQQNKLLVGGHDPTSSSGHCQ